MRAMFIVAVLLLSSVAYAQEASEPEVESNDTDVAVQAEDAPASAEARLKTKNPWLGQMALVEVTLKRDARFKDAQPFFGETHVDGALVQQARYTPIPASETVDGKEVLVQTRVYQVFAQYGESVTFPRLEVSWFDGDERQSVLTNEVEIPLRAPADAAKRTKGPWVASPKLSIEQTVAGDIEAFKVGDSITRTIRLESEDTDAVMLPAPEFGDIVGLTKYVAEPKLTSKVTRGRYKAVREDRVTYVAQRWGFYTLPAIRFEHFSTTAGAWDQVVAEPIEFRARVNPQLGTSCVGSAESVVPAGWIVFVLLLLIYPVLKLTKVRPEETTFSKERDLEPERFKDLLAAAKAGDSKATLNAVYRWFRVRKPNPVTLDSWAVDDAEFSNDAERLNAEVVGQQDWDASKFAQGASKHRFDTTRDHQKLPELN